MTLERLAPAKINLGLHVLRRRSDGYHDLDTVFLRIPWADRVEAHPGEGITLTCTDPDLPVDERNLCMKAALHLAEARGVRRGAALHLEKHVPYGAGLGGGSSDAAATLCLLSRLWELDVSEAELHALGAGLGSDVPFFLGGAAARGTGRGEKLTPLRSTGTGELYEFPFPLLVVVPPVAVPTAEAYRMVRPRREGRPDLAALVGSNDLAAWRRELVNDFEAPVLEAYPVIRAVKDALLEGGAAYASLSGSGSAVFGVFEEEAQGLGVAEAARRAGHRVWYGRP